MELNIAIYRATQILYEERVRPTTRYQDLGYNWIEETKKLTEAMKVGTVTKSESLVTMANGSRRLNLFGMRNLKSRTVSETPKEFFFSSVNWDLLKKVFAQVQESERAAFIDAVLTTIETQGDHCASRADYHFPVFEGQVSEFPLIAEFAIRAGYTKELFERMKKAQVPTPGLALMLNQLVETLSLNFTVFSEEQLAMMGSWLMPVREMADLQTYSSRGPRRSAMVENPLYKPGREKPANEIVRCIDNLFSEISQALFFYLKGALQESPNLEIEDDKVKVEGFLDSLGFDPLLICSLKRAEDLYRSNSDAFDLKSCIGHIRSFYEHVHIGAATAIAGQTHETVVPEFDPAINLLKNRSFLSSQQEKFARGLYTLLSNEGVHPLIAEREFARLLRNMVIEYQFMFLTMLQKKGITIRVLNVQTATGMQRESI